MFFFFYGDFSGIHVQGVFCFILGYPWKLGTTMELETMFNSCNHVVISHIFSALNLHFSFFSRSEGRFSKLV